MFRRMLPWLSLPLLAACSGGDSDQLGESLGARDGGTADAGEEPTPEDAASAPDGEAPRDAESPGPDAEVPEDGGVDGVRVRVRSGGGPEQAAVLLHDGEGTLLGQPLRTDAAGEVFTELAPSMVTVVLDSGTGSASTYRFAQLITYTGVESGDVLTVEVPRTYVDAEASYVVTLPAPYPNGGGSIDVTGGSTGCAYGSAGGTAPVAVYVSCALPESGNALLASFTDEGGAEWFTWDGALSAPSGEVATPVTFSQAWTRGSALAVSLEGLAADAPLDVWSELDMLRSGARFTASSDGALAEGLTYVVVPDFAGEVEALVGYRDYPSDAPPRLATVAKRRPSDSASVAFSFGDFLDVPRSISVEAGSDALRPTLRFSGPLERSGVDALIASAQLFWTEGDSATSLTWRAIVPPDATSFTLPALPPLFVLDGPSASIQPSVDIASVGDDVAEGFDAYRARPFRVAQDNELSEVPIRIDATDCSEQKVTALLANLNTGV